jgi:hypothetical protein
VARTGRPIKLTDVVAQRAVIDPTTKQPTGETQPVTRTEQIVGDIRIGLTAHRAAKRAGIHRDTLDDWERQAVAVREAIERLDGQMTLTAKEAELLDFSDALHKAELEYQVQCEMLLQQAAQGGLVVTETTETYGPDGTVTSTRTTRKTLPPDPKVTQWRVARRFPADYVERVQIEGTGDGGAIPLAVRAEAVGDALAQWLATKPAQEPAADDPEGPQTPS